mmetsp:Transcript_14408/g.42235  ORF Transcript_14408/g.42235 Transcript_14408/m.42235 type:complete len:436 (-) Transcript_14408:294-1601(-)|eukprot:CAMPEP_0113549012 /NCGR_PEP_ID=MMETSP0015_2-20120614/13205_1 /TAXON_ID=2838 /ORGANISM="Odontella" /LENGTH=435 /DNA_ID=CAMNT_0000449691 /DNA_START=107 /DNA_END=1414 /DNA_ORIENTATION=+ /assembly_acc=CAM_ASM_000160
MPSARAESASSDVGAKNTAALITPDTTPPSSQEEGADAAFGSNRSVRRSLQSEISFATVRAPPSFTVESVSVGAATGTFGERGRRSDDAADAAEPSHASDSSKRRRVASVTPRNDSGGEVPRSSAGRFGHAITTLPSVRRAYGAMHRRTGSIGGNGHGGAIYGEITEGSMQKVIEVMKAHTNLGRSSRFIDVGCGLGKPNVHVALDCGVEVSYGVEMERLRWWLGMNNLDAVIDSAAKNKTSKGIRCMMAHADITEARTFAPFTHVYMFDIGFPPELMYTLASMFNDSCTSEFLICYHSPRLIIQEYGFEVELLVQRQTSMFGSSENHMCYFYRRYEQDSKVGHVSGVTSEDGEVMTEPSLLCDPLFQKDFELVRSSTRGELATHVRTMIQSDTNLVKGNGSDTTEDDVDFGARKSGRKRRPPKKFDVEGYVYND